MLKRRNSKGNVEKPWRLRTRLGVALIALFIAIFVMMLLSHYEYSKDRREARVDGMQNTSRTVAALFDGFIRDLESFSLSTAITLGDARTPITVEDSPRLQPSVGPYLQHLFESYGILRAIFVTDLQGRVVYSNQGTPPGVDLSSRDYIQALRNGATDYWSGGFPGSETGNTTIAYSRAIVNPDGASTGFLVIAFFPSELASRLPGGLAGNGHISLFDENGTLLLHLPSSEASPSPAGIDVSSWPPFAAAQGGSEVVLRDSEIPASSGDTYGSLVPLRGAHWVAGYTLPSREIDGSANALFRRNLLIFSTILAAGLGVMLFIADRLSQPLTRLATAAGAIARGESVSDLLDTKHSDAEIATLAATMDVMQRAIRVREEQLQGQSAALESIEHIGEALASELDLEKVVGAITESGIALMDAEAALFLMRAGASGEFEVISSAGPKPSVILPLEDPLVQEVVGGTRVQVAGLAAPHASPTLANVEGTAGRARSSLGMPVISRSGEIEGALVLFHSNPDAFNSLHLRMATGLARWAGIVVENAKLYKQSQQVLELLRQANISKDEFLAIVSHELRTPITTIYGGTRLLRVRRKNLPEQAVEDLFESVSEEAERLYLLVEDLLAIARTEMAEEVEREPVALAMIVEQAVALFSRGHEREVDLRIEADLPPALGEPTYVQQVVTNLISNAHKYTPPEHPIEVEATADRAELIVRVMDRGPGVTDPELEQIFESFYRSREAAERATGKGLGLTVCKRLIEALGGRIWAENRTGGGLIVSFTLEIAALEAPELTIEEQSCRYHRPVNG